MVSYEIVANTVTHHMRRSTCVPALSSNFSMDVPMQVKRLRFTSIRVMSRTHFITWAFPNGFGHISAETFDCRAFLS